MDDLYLILGVDSGANLETIQKRFRFLAQAFHPDKYSGTKQKQLAEEEFKKINNAYQILSNPRTRTNYDLQRNRNINYSRTNPNDVNRKAQESASQRTSAEKKKKEEARQTKEEQLQKERADKERAEAEKRCSPAITTKEVIKVWRQIASSVVDESSNLAALLNSVKMVDVQGSNLVLGFGSDVVKSMMKPKEIERTRKAVSDVLGVTLDIFCVVIPIPRFVN